MSGYAGAILANQRYGCEISRRPMETEFRMESFERNSQEMRDKIEAARIQAFSLAVGSESVDGIALDPSFKILRAEAKGQNADELVEIYFESDVTHQRGFNVKGGQFVLSPTKNWAVVSFCCGSNT